jgi:hypothetical protein
MFNSPQDLASAPGEWSVSIGQEIPGVPPPVVIYALDGGAVVSYDPDAGDSFDAPLDLCMSAFNEPANCGKPVSDASPCLAKTCNGQCGAIEDGCGGVLNCPCEAEGGKDAAPTVGDQPVFAPSNAAGCDAGGSSFGLSPIAALSTALLGLAFATRRRCIQPRKRSNCERAENRKS